MVEIMKFCLMDKLVDETGVLDFRRGGGRSKQVGGASMHMPGLSSPARIILPYPALLVTHRMQWLSCRQFKAETVGMASRAVAFLRALAAPCCTRVTCC